MYYMKTLRYLLIVLTLSSCNKDWLDVKADSKLIVPETLLDFQSLLDDVTYMNFSDVDKGEIASDGHYISDVNYVNSSLDENKDAYLWSKTTQHLGVVGSVWATAHTKILYCNTVLDGLKKIEPQNASELNDFNSIKGQALFQRSIAFFQLAQIYTPPITVQNGSQKLGVFLRLTSDITVPSKRSTINGTFDQIISDLKVASELLPNRPKILTRGSKSSAYAQLTRTYLYLGDYDSALKYASDCLTIYSDLLDYNLVVPNKGYIGALNKEVLFHSTFNSSDYITSYCLVDSNLVKLYNQNDLRKSLYFLKASNGSYSFQGNYNNTAYLIFNGIALDEVYLSRAECYARNGNVNAAMTDLNTLLKSRWNKNVQYIDLVASNADDALIKILLERKKSLFLRGIRWMDLRRLNKDPRFITTVSRTVNGTIHTLEPNSYKYVFPIPDGIITQTGELQNPGWE